MDRPNDFKRLRCQKSIQLKASNCAVAMMGFGHYLNYI